MSERVTTWGALRPAETVPLAFFAPPPASSGLRAEFNAPGSAVRAWGLGRDVPPEPPWARPPKPGSLGWNWTLGKTAHFAGTKLFPR